MTYTVSITSQGQISIPAALRRKFDFDKTKRALITEDNGNLIIEPVKDLLELAGSLKTKRKPLSNQKLHELFAKSVAEEYIKKVKRTS